MAKTSDISGMRSRRILYSDLITHRVMLTEQELGVLQHAAYVLAAAFSLEPDYLALIGNVRNKLEDAFKKD